MDGRPLYLEPRLEPRLRSLVAAHGTLHSIVDALGSPLHVVVPDQIAENLERFRSVYRAHRLSGQVFYAHKANRSSALLRRLAATDAGVDVASLGELQHALGAGFGADRITATGPKNPEFLWLAARTGVTVGVDGVAELDRLAALVRGARARPGAGAAAAVGFRDVGCEGAEPTQPFRYAGTGVGAAAGGGRAAR